jgi:hypothetical protein
MTEVVERAWWDDPSGPYEVGDRSFETRQALYDALKAMEPMARRRVRVTAGWRDEDGDYVFSVLVMNRAKSPTP